MADPVPEVETPERFRGHLVLGVRFRFLTVRDLPEHLGGVDQVSDSTDLLSCPALRVRLRSLYGR